MVGRIISSFQIGVRDLFVTNRQILFILKYFKHLGTIMYLSLSGLLTLAVPRGTDTKMLGIIGLTRPSGDSNVQRSDRRTVPFQMYGHVASGH